MNDILKDINFVDLHSHILPYIDDGAKDIQTTIDMLNIAENSGISHIISTPHYIQGPLNNNADIVEKELSKLLKIVEESALKIKIYPGSEAFINPNLPELVEQGVVCTLNNSSYILIELPMSSIPPYTEEVFYNLQIKGFRPIIAHPERNSEIIKDPNLLYYFIERGSLSQINSYSFTGLYGSSAKETALTLLEHSMVHFVASDAHSSRRRAPKLTKAFNIVKDIVGYDTALKLFSANGLSVIENMNIDIPEPKLFKIKRNFFITSLHKLGIIT